MNSEGLGRCLKVTLQTHAPGASGGQSRGSSVRRPGSEDLHRRERNLNKVSHKINQNNLFHYQMSSPNLEANRGQ